MKGAVFKIVSAAALASAGPSLAQSPIAQDPVAEEFAAEESLLQLGNAQRRMTVPVSIGDSGPYGFIVDTGSERTVVSRELSRHLKLGPGRAVRVTAMTGASVVDTVVVPALSVSRISRTTVTAPELEGANLGAPGILGVDTLQGHAVSIDFDKNQMSLRPVKGRRSRATSVPGEVVVVAKSLLGQLIVTDAHYRGKKISVIIDTGTSVTIGNPALLALMRKPPMPLGTISVTSVTGQVLNADYAQVDQLEVGGIELRSVPVGFVDAPPFARLGLGDRPALMLGMDVLRLFRSVQIDFVSRQIRFLFPRSARFEGIASREL